MWQQFADPAGRLRGQPLHPASRIDELMPHRWRTVDTA